jgi:hypothetical protein
MFFAAWCACAMRLVCRYSRYVGDINMRRGFLDKRGCIETTFRLKHEKDKEVRGDTNQVSCEKTTFIVIFPFSWFVSKEHRTFLSIKTHPSIQLDTMAKPATQKRKERLEKREERQPLWLS